MDENNTSESSLKWNVNFSNKARFFLLLENRIIQACLLTLSWRRSLSYRNQSIDLLSTSMDWDLYDNGPRHERVKMQLVLIFVVVSLHFSNLIFKTLQYPQMKVIRFAYISKKAHLSFYFWCYQFLRQHLTKIVHWPQSHFSIINIGLMRVTHFTFENWCLTLQSHLMKTVRMK